MANISPVYSVSLAIKQEIQRFESVHPSIYAIYDLIEAIDDRELQDSIRDHVVCIEDSFVNSQEWTLSRNVPELKLGVIGSVHSGKSALVHRYLTGSYMQDESPEGGRFKKEVMVDGSSSLLLIRDEGRPPDQQFAAWCDACLFVFALDNADSFDAVYQFYNRMSQYRNLADMPILLVGTQDSISESRPRVIDEAKTRKCAQDLRRCVYLETCATYGHNVDRVFQEACHRIVTSQQAWKKPSAAQTPGQQQQQPGGSHMNARGGLYNVPPPGKDVSKSSGRFSGPVAHVPSPTQQLQLQQYHQQQQQQQPLGYTDYSGGSGGADPIGQYYEPPVQSHPMHSFGTPVSYQPLTPPHPMLQQQQQQQQQHGKPVKKSDSLLRDKAEEQQLAAGFQHADYSAYYASASVPSIAPGSCQLSLPPPPPLPPHHQPQPQQQQLGQRVAKDRSSFAQGSEKSDKDATPNATPTQNRKNKRRSNLFNRKDSSNPPEEQQQQQQQIPATMQQQQQQQGKFFPLSSSSNAGNRVGPPLGSGRAIPVKQGSLYKKAVNALNREWKKKYVTLSEDGKLTYHPNLHDYMENSHGKDIDLSRTTVKIPGQLRPTSNGLLKSQQQQQQQPEDGSKKRRHRRAKSGNRGGGGGGADQDVEESDGYEFMIVSLENRTWHFEAASQEERDEWVRAIEHSILRSLQGPSAYGNYGTSGGSSNCLAGGGGSGGGNSGSGSIRGVFGNTECADCGRPGPDWASLNLGALVCIECSGVHRQLGTHLSRIRSLTLDDWPANHLLVMRAIGNKLANSVWEARLPCHATFRKPSPESDREAKEIFIRAKYERREFLPDLPFRDSPVQQQLVDAIARSDTRQVILCLAVAGPAVNEPYSKQDPRAAIHIAATLGQLVYLQLLLWHGADVAIRDAEGRNAHFYATAAGKPDCAEFLRAAGCPAGVLPASASAAAASAASSSSPISNPSATASVASASAAAAASTLPRRRSKTTPTTATQPSTASSGNAPTQSTAEIGL
ncbi:hypothetical protein BOX15_Mlig028593g1 [Macrostomum lignano]|uniref:Arf-GAP with GTPase, ANK repeat and PH domain-containing protein 1 n=1 Tax=Macrostomum lignano TaxID=282301 RepID=A0A267E8N8_9PLAT|nr:hypothetical protein BOX15_Mlig028593g1 [Macrostomum lignano]